MMMNQELRQMMEATASQFQTSQRCQINSKFILKMPRRPYKKCVKLWRLKCHFRFFFLFS